MTLRDFDTFLISKFRRISAPAARIALFVVFFWFGILKVLGVSPAGELVESLFHATIPWMDFRTFYLGFALFECLIGILFLFPRTTRVVIPLLAIHMMTTFLPLIVLPAATWASWFVPTLEGQYIIKNLVIIAAAMGIAAELAPMGGNNPEKK